MIRPVWRILLATNAIPNLPNFNHCPKNH